MNDTPFIIILPAYNAEQFLERSVGSVTEQGYPDYRVVIINDGSSDDTGALADRLAKPNDRVCVIHQQNSGQIVSRTNGVRYAMRHFKTDGAYFLFLDADDAFKPGAFRRINQLLNETPCDILIFDAERTDSSSGKTTGLLGGEAEGLFTSKSEIYKTVLYDYRYNSLCRKAVSAKAVEDINYDRFSRLRHAEDLIQSLGYFKNAAAVSFVKDSLYLYYANPKSVTNQVNIENYPIESTARAYSWEFIKQENVWTKDALDAYAVFLLDLMEKKLTSISLLSGTTREKAVLFDRMKSDPFYSELLSRDLPHSRMITLLVQGKYSPLIKTAKLKRITNKLTRR